MTESRLDDPRYDPCARDFHLHRELPVRIHGEELFGLIAEVDEALDQLEALPDERALDEEHFYVTTVLLVIEQFLKKLRERFDAVGKAAP